MSYLFNIYFEASTIEGVIIKNEKVLPEMFNPHIFSTFKVIFISPFVKFNSNYFSQNLGDDDKKIVFFNLPQFQNYIQRIKEKENIKSLSLKQAKEKKIIDQNCYFLLHLFFQKNQPFTIRNRKYLINTFKWDGTYQITLSSQKKIPQINVKINIFLHEGSQMSFIESTRLSCLQKRQKIIKDYHTLVNLKQPSKKTADYKYIPQSKEQLKKIEEEKKKAEEEKKKKEAEKKKNKK